MPPRGIEQLERQWGRDAYRHQLARYREALDTILDVPEMASDDIFENADYAFACPELFLAGEEQRMEYAQRVGQTVREYSQLLKPGLGDFRLELLARAAGVFARRFEVFASRSVMNPDDCGHAARAVIEDIFPDQTVIWRGGKRKLTAGDIAFLSGVAGAAEDVRSYPDLARRWRTPDVLARAQIILATAMAFPGLLEWSRRSSVRLSEQGLKSWVSVELARWLEPEPGHWFQPERVLSGLRLGQEWLHYLSQQGIKVDASIWTTLVAATQAAVLERLTTVGVYQTPQRRRLELLFLDLAGFSPLR